MARNTWSNSGVSLMANSSSSFLQPGSIRDPGDVPKNWEFEFRAGVDEYQRMHKGKLLRIRKSSARTAAQVYWVYSGIKYLGSFSTLTEAVEAAMN